jgi:acyl-coenzyme A synthetase/AMP-(fatty) acid ligase
MLRTGARLNIAWSAVAGPRAGAAGAPAILWAAEAEPTRLQSVTWEQLRERCLRVAARVAAAHSPGVLLPCVVSACCTHIRGSMACSAQL